MVRKHVVSGMFAVPQILKCSQAPKENELNLLYESHPAETQVDGLPWAASFFDCGGGSIVMYEMFTCLIFRMCSLCFIVVCIFFVGGGRVHAIYSLFFHAHVTTRISDLLFRVLFGLHFRDALMFRRFQDRRRFRRRTG